MIEVTKRRKSNGRFGRIRVFVSGYDEPSWDHPPYTKKGDDPQADADWKRYNREEIRLMREVVEEAVAQDPVLAAQLGRFSFSRKAGCSCSCSPGFVAEGRGMQDVWISRIDPNEAWLKAGA